MTSTLTIPDAELQRWRTALTKRGAKCTANEKLLLEKAGEVLRLRREHAALQRQVGQFRAAIAVSIPPTEMDSLRNRVFALSDNDAAAKLIGELDQVEAARKSELPAQKAQRDALLARGAVRAEILKLRIECAELRERHARTTELYDCLAKSAVLMPRRSPRYFPDAQ